MTIPSAIRGRRRPGTAEHTVTPDGPAPSNDGGGPAPNPVDEVPSAWKLLVYGLQHLLVMYASTITVPVVVASALDLSQQDLVYLVTADLLLCGFGTLLQSLGIWRVGVRLPMVIGASYTGIAPMLIIGQGSGLQTMYGAVLVVGLATIAVAPLVGKMMRFFPPVVIGTTILLIGIQLIPAGAKMIVGTDPDASASDHRPPSAWLL